MSEDIPLDPNQVQPPSESEATHIEVTSHEGGDSRVDDIDKARDMAEAGDEYRTKAREHREGAQGTKNFYQEGSPLNSMTPAGRAEYHDNQAEGAEKFAGEIYDEAQTSDHSNNADKAKQMILAERARERNLAAPTPKEAGDKYDLEAAKEQIHKSRGEALKDTPGLRVTEIFLRYSRVIAENYRKHGDELTVNLKALELVAKSVVRHGRINQYEFGKYVTVSLNDEKGGAIDITTGGRKVDDTTEKWHIPMFDDDPKGHKHTGTYAQPRDFAYYEVTESASDPDGDFDRVQTEKTRSLGDKDLANLDKLLGKVSAFKTAERENTLYPGDEGYEEELAEINYGRDKALG